MAMPEGFDELLRRKYDIMQQGVDNQRLGIMASANLDTVKAGLLPGESTAGIGLTKAQTDKVGADAASTREATRFIAPLAQSSIGLNAANAVNARAGAGLYGSQTRQIDQDIKIQPLSFQFRGLGDNLGNLDTLVRNAFRGGM